MTISVKERYRENGFYCPVPIMEASEAQDWRNQLEAVERRYSDQDSLPRPISEYLRTNAHIVLPMANRIARDPRILSVVEDVMGPDLLIWSVEFFIKEAKTDKVVSWHQDLTYWGLGATDDEVTAWLALSPATRESGCMQFIPGSQKHNLLPHRDSFAADNLLSRGQEISVDVNEDDAVMAELQPGELSLHHGRLFHASGPNTSNDRRIGCVIRYITPEVRQHVAKQDYAMPSKGDGDTGSFILITGPKGEFDVKSLDLYEQVIADQSAVLFAGAEKTIKHPS